MKNEVFFSNHIFYCGLCRKEILTKELPSGWFGELVPGLYCSEECLKQAEQSFVEIEKKAFAASAI